MFFNGYPSKGYCPAGGGHDAAGYNFALPHFIPGNFHGDIITQDWLPAGGSVDVVMNANGDFTFSGHMHNSGGLNIQYALAVVIMTSSGIGFSFARDHQIDGTITIFGRNRDDDWIDTGNNPQIVGNWDQITYLSGLFWRLNAHDTLSRGIQGLIEDVAEDAAKAIAQAGIQALISLI